MKKVEDVRVSLNGGKNERINRDSCPSGGGKLGVVLGPRWGEIVGKVWEQSQ
jgi:hypothetical protein